MLEFKLGCYNLRLAIAGTELCVTMEPLSSCIPSHHDPRFSFAPVRWNSSRPQHQACAAASPDLRPNRRSR